MGLNRGKKRWKKGRLSWANKLASHGRRACQGKRPAFWTWKDAKRELAKIQTTIVIPEKADEGTGDDKKAGKQAKA